MVLLKKKKKIKLDNLQVVRCWVTYCPTMAALKKTKKNKKYTLYRSWQNKVPEPSLLWNVHGVLYS